MHGLIGLVDTAVLLGAELVANAVRHTKSQLTEILELSGAGGTSVRVILSALEHLIDVGAAMVYAGGAVPRLDTVVRDGPHGTGFVDSEAQLGVFRTHFRRLQSASLDPGRSRDFIHRLTKEL